MAADKRQNWLYYGETFDKYSELDVSLIEKLF